MEKTSERLAANVRAELARRRLTRRKVAHDLGWSLSGLQRRVTGEAPFDVDELYRLAAYLDVPVVSLMGEERAGAA